ncbi:DNA repair protein RecN (Recombination protein N) [Anaerobranca californiensis DSM 14826]|jgi:DNA repair protein RecN (Recombination protein N)|uniref:DNA repair protein RecN n=1 Tax=Anaerobranca californiensis DSM 14826 TaxID=1120989 RepID=A0A1M6L5V9_9FIRM|nr:DNA repair protein RecN [Anaerobranca californiensis]SHJ66591.1 DNA repair protein RecN (Recombination protein N) [Anaerobranca californiensis DSM 14826]
MIDRISIENFALIEALEIDFNDGLTVLSGETGAGKSIIIDALTLLTGGRASAELVRSGCEKSIITGVFSLTPLKSKKINEILGIDVDDQLIIEREIYSSGKSIAKVNNKIITIGLLKDLTKDLVDIHGQHEHHSLLDPQKHLSFLDLYGGKAIGQLLTSYNELYVKRRDILNRLNKLHSNNENRERQMDLLKFEIEEIENCNLTIGEDEELLNHRKLLINAEKLYNGVMNSYNHLYQGEENPSVIEVIGSVISHLEHLTKYDDNLSKFIPQLEGALFQIQDVSRELFNYGQGLDLDPEALTSVEMRIDEINRLKRKYGPTIEDVLDYYKQRKLELEELINSEELFKKLQGELKIVEQKLLEVGHQLSLKRKELALDLSTKISIELADMSMEKTKFEVYFKKNNGEFYETGLDQVEFLISPNPGEPLKPLAKISSGGELSRIMLAMKNILAQIDQIETLVFDEVDTGIGGRTAQRVAEKLLNVSKGRQVLCVSHLPQICVMADNHYKIEKKEVDGRTISTIRRLDGQEKILEIARMISGAEITQGTINHAKEMLALAQGFKN